GFFFFQAEDGIRYRNVTGVQTCALPILMLELGVYALGSLAGLDPFSTSTSTTELGLTKSFVSLFLESSVIVFLNNACGIFVSGRGILLSSYPVQIDIV